MTDNDEPARSELVLPFVLVKSAGGPYDDDAFVAGFQLGELRARLAIANTLNTSIEATVWTSSLRQVDLIAMSERFTVDHEPITPILPSRHEWALITLRPERNTDD